MYVLTEDDICKSSFHNVVFCAQMHRNLDPTLNQRGRARCTLALQSQLRHLQSMFIYPLARISRRTNL